MSGLSRFFLDPLAHEFMQRGLLVAVVVGTTCALLSCFLVLKGWSLMGDAISHAVLPGIALAELLGMPLVIGAVASGLLCALATGHIGATSRVKQDAVMGIVFSGMFALGLVMFVKIDTDQHLLHVLFGNMLGVGWRDVAETALIGVPVAAFVVARRRDLSLYCFDPTHAGAIGISPSRLRLILLVLLACAVVTALKAVGAILVIAMLITPGATGYLLARRIDGMLLVAVISANLACVLGTLLSFHFDTATGPMIVVLQGVIFCLALAATALRARWAVGRDAAAASGLEAGR